MKGKRVVLDGYNLLMPRGTGIATYARTLALSLSALGAEVGVLAPVQFRTSRKWPDLNEVKFHEALPAPDVRPGMRWARNLSDFLGSFGSFRPEPLKLRGVASGSGEALLPDNIELLLAHRLVERAEARFSMLGRDLNVRLPNAPSVFHSTYHLPIRIHGAANIYTIHDLIPLRLPGTTRDNKRYTYRLLKHVTARADHIVTVSEHSRRDIMELLDVPPERVTNTYQAVAMPADVLAREADHVAEVVRRIFDLEYQEYFLFFGAIEPKKNVLKLINAYVSSGAESPLVIVGSEAWMADAEMERLRDPSFESFHILGTEIRRRHRVRHIKYLPRNLLLYLIQGARAVVFPSLYEGFGLPVLEAMMLGTPVITSKTSSLEEVAGEAALLVDPRDASSISSAIRVMDNDTDLRRHLSQLGRIQAQKFSEHSYRERLDKLYRRVA
nr:glycosyltransferase [uncultured Roseococcus sp.]